jgi:hypothetical protein
MHRSLVADSIIETLVQVLYHNMWFFILSLKEVPTKRIRRRDTQHSSTQRDATSYNFLNMVMLSVLALGK